MKQQHTHDFTTDQRRHQSEAARSLRSALEALPVDADHTVPSRTELDSAAAVLESLADLGSVASITRS